MDLRELVTEPIDVSALYATPSSRVAAFKAVKSRQDKQGST
jgi:hypothetical protein